MQPVKAFKVFGETVEILTTTGITGGRSTTLIQTSPPGGGPPPHSHQHEDETFVVLEGIYELLLNGERIGLAAGEAAHAMRGSVHAFHNVGTETGKMLIFVSPGGFEKYLEEISPLSMPNDLAEVVAISDRYGISFAS